MVENFRIFCLTRCQNFVSSKSMNTIILILLAYMSVCSCTCACAYRVGQNVPQRSPVTDAVPVDSQQPALEDDHNYSTVDDMQQQMLSISANAAYQFVPEHSQHPLQEDDQAFANIDISQQEEVVTCGKPGYGTAPGAAARNK